MKLISCRADDGRQADNNPGKLSSGFSQSIHTVHFSFSVLSSSQIWHFIFTSSSISCGWWGLFLALDWNSFFSFCSRIHSTTTGGRETWRQRQGVRFAGVRAGHLTSWQGWGASGAASRWESAKNVSVLISSRVGFRLGLQQLKC